MSTAELKKYADQRTPEERRWLARYLWELERDQDNDALVEFDRRMAEMDAGKSKVTWTEASARLDSLDRQGR